MSITESAHRDVCDALHRAIVERDSLRAEVERLQAPRTPGPDVSLLLAAESMDIRRRADGTWIASLRDDPSVWRIRPTLREVIAAVTRREVAHPA